MSELDFDAKTESPSQVAEVVSEKPTLPPAPVVVFKDVGKETPVEQLRGNIEHTIKQASLPVAQLLELLREFEKIDLEVLDGGSRYTAWEKWRVHYYTKLQTRMGSMEGYSAALAQSVITFLQERNDVPKN